jgi:type I restriction enzyme S subunit
VKWTTVALGEVADIERNSISPADIESGSRYVGLEHIESGGASLSFGSVSNGELASNKFSFGPQHILFGKLRPYLAKIVCPNFKGICSTDILPIAPRERVDRRYLLHFLRRPETVAWASSRSTGVNLPRLSPTELSSLEVVLPPLHEQRRIAAILDKADALRRKRIASGLLIGKALDADFIAMFGLCEIGKPNWPSLKVSEVGVV